MVFDKGESPCIMQEVVNLVVPLSRSHKYQKEINHDRPLTVPMLNHDGSARPIYPTARGRGSNPYPTCKLLHYYMCNSCPIKYL